MGGIIYKINNMGSHMINILVELNRLTCTTLAIMSCDDSERQLTLIVDLSKLLTCHNCCPFKKPKDETTVTLLIEPILVEVG